MQVGLLIGLYSLCEVIFSPLWGTFADKVGRKPGDSVSTEGLELRVSFLRGLGQP